MGMIGDQEIEAISRLIDLARSKHVKALKLDGLEFQLDPLPPAVEPDSLAKGQSKNLFGIKAGNPTTEQFLFAASEGMSDEDIMDNQQE